MLVVMILAMITIVLSIASIVAEFLDWPAWAHQSGLYCPDCNMPMNECLCDVEGEDEGCSVKALRWLWYTFIGRPDCLRGTGNVP